MVLAKSGKAGLSCENGVSNCPLIDGLSCNEETQILAIARKKRYSRGDLLCLDGEVIRDVYLITDGAVKVMKFTDGGDAVIFRLGLPGDLICPGSLFRTSKYSSTVVSLRATKALVWPAQNFRAILERCPLLFQNYLQIQHRHMLEIEERFCEMATMSVNQRLARQLSRLHGRMIAMANGDTEIGVSREELAQMTGTTAFSACRALVEWEARGIIRSRRESVKVCDADSLRALSD